MIWDQCGRTESQRGAIADMNVTAPRLVSVIIPAFNADQFIEATLDSVMAQDYPAIEVVVVDDGSTDATANRVLNFSSSARFPIRIITQANKGVSAARNAGASVAHGELLALLDADDLWLPAKVSTQVASISQRTGPMAVLCAYTLFDSISGRKMGEVRPSATWAFFRDWLTLQGPGPLLPSTLMLPRMEWDQVGGFNEALSTAADADLGLRLFQRGSLEVVDEVLVRYRLRPGQMHRSHDALRRDFAILANDEYLGHNRDLVGLMRGNVEIHIAREKWRHSPHAGTFLKLILILVRHPRQTLRRFLWSVRRTKSSSDSGDL